MSVNLNQYAETLLESELFGHTKGSFTGAVSSYDGLLSLCGKHGSVFLDESTRTREGRHKLQWIYQTVDKQE